MIYIHVLNEYYSEIPLYRNSEKLDIILILPHYNSITKNIFIFAVEITDLTEMHPLLGSAVVRVGLAVEGVVRLLREEEAVEVEDLVETISLPAEAEPSLSCRNKTPRIWATRSGKLLPRVAMF